MAATIRRILRGTPAIATPQELSASEVEQILDARARKTLGMSGPEFIRRLADGELPETSAVADLAILVSGGAA